MAQRQCLAARECEVKVPQRLLVHHCERNQDWPHDRLDRPAATITRVVGQCWIGWWHDIDRDPAAPDSTLHQPDAVDLADSPPSWLIKCLREGKIAGAALDVFITEPIPEDSPFLELDNVTLTTHIAGTTADALGKSPYLLMNEMAKLIKGEDSGFVVNREVIQNPEFKAWLDGVRA